jgi:tape measure domain-containing protein
MLGGEIKIVMSLDDSDMSVKTAKAGETLMQLNQKIQSVSASTATLEKYMSGLGAKFHDTVFSMSLVRFALKDIEDVLIGIPKSIADASGQLERMHVMLEGLTGSTDGANKSMKFLLDMAQTTPFNITELSNAFVKFKAAGLDPMDGSLRAVTDTLAKFGGGSLQLKEVSLAVQEMGDKGVVSLKELRRQLGQAMPNSIQAMAQALNMSVGQLDALVKTGTLQAQDAMGRMFAVLGAQNDGMASRMMNTWTGMESRLETQWLLFKDRMGKEGLLDNAEEQMGKVLNAMSGSNINEFAAHLGADLNSAVSAVVNLSQMVVKFSDELKVAGEVALAYWGAGKLRAGMQEMANLIDTMRGKLLLYADVEQAEREQFAMESEAWRQGRIAELQDRMAVNEALIASEQRATEMQINQRLKLSETQYQFNLKEIEDNQAKLDSLLAEQKAYEGEIAALDEKAELLRARKKKSSGVVTEAAEKRYALELSKAETAEMEANIAMRQKQNAVIAESATTVRAETIALNEEQMALLASNEAAAGAIVTLQELDTAAVEMTAAERAAAIATGVLDSAIAMLIDPMNILIGIIGVAGLAWSNYSSEADKAAEASARAKRAARGVSSEEDVNNGQGRVAELQKQIADLEAFKKAGSREISTGAGGRAPASHLETYNDKYEEQLRRAKADLAEAAKTLGDQKTLLTQQNANDSADGQLRLLDAQWAPMQDKFTQQRNAYLASLSKGDIAKGKQNPTLNALDAKETQAHIDFLQKNLDAIAALQKKEKDQNSQHAADLRAQSKALGDAQQEYVNRLAQINKGVNNVAPTLVQADKKKKGAGGVEREDPWNRLAAELETQQADASVRLAAARGNVDRLASINDKATLDVLGRIAKGELDTTSEGKDGKKVKNVVGGSQSERLSWITQFSAQIKEGKANADAFIDSLVKAQKLTQEQGSQIKQKISATANTQKDISEAELLEDTNKQLAETQAKYNEEMTRTVDGSGKGSKALQELTRHFAELEASTKGAGAALADYQQNKQQALLNQTMTDSHAFNIKAQQDLKKANEGSLSGHDRADADLATRLDEENQRYQTQIDLLNQYAAGLDKASAAYKNYQTQLADAKKGHEVESAAIQQSYANQTKTQLEKMGDQWQDITEQMNSASASWAKNFMSYTERALEGGKVNWKKALAGMVQDIGNIAIQKALSNVVTSAFGSLGTTLTNNLNGAAGLFGGLLGGKSSSGGAQDSDNQKLAASTAALTNNTQASAAALLAHTAATESGTLMDKIRTMFGMEMSQPAEVTAATAMQVLATAADSAASALWQISATQTAHSAGGAFAFANGGIMTDMGSMPLKMYSGGGVANSPQMAIFGEGSSPEAYVPLPDGRSIPVTMKATGGSDSGSSHTQNYVNVNVTNSGQTTTDANSSAPDQSKGWSDLAQRLSQMVQGEIMNQQRPGGLLHNQ